MIALDTLTTFVIAGLLYLVLPLNAWLALLRQRSRAVDLWCLGGMIGGTGILLVGLRNTTPDWLGYPVANGFIILSFLLRIQSVHFDLGRPHGTRLLGGLFLAFLAGYLPLFALGAEHALGIWTRSWLLAGTAWLVFVTYRLAVREHSRNALTISLAYAAMVVGFGIMLAMTLAGTSTITQPLAGPASKILALITILASIIGHFSYVGLVLERTRHNRAALAMENARVEAARQQSSELAAIDRRCSLGAMTASLRHELSQPLTAIHIITQLAQRTLRAGVIDAPALSDQLEKIVLNIHRTSQIIEQIRRFVRPTVTRHEPVDLRQTVREVLQLLRQDLLKQRIQLTLDLPAEPATVIGDPVQLSQVLMHALLNAVDACAARSAHEVQLRLCIESDTVVLEIRDQGAGLDAEALARAGTPFFTTKPGRLGLGLAVSSQILRTLQGEITLENAAHGGACTRIRLPRAATAGDHLAPIQG